MSFTRWILGWTKAKKSRTRLIGTMRLSYLPTMTIPAGSGSLRLCKMLHWNFSANSNQVTCNLVPNFEFLFHCRWQWRFFLRHHKKEFGLKDLPKPRAKDEADYVHNEFLGYWQAEVERARKRNRQPNLIYPIFQQYGLRAFFMFIFCFLNVSLLLFFMCFFLKVLIRSLLLSKSPWPPSRSRSI